MAAKSRWYYCKHCKEWKIVKSDGVAVCPVCGKSLVKISDEMAGEEENESSQKPGASL